MKSTIYYVFYLLSCLMLCCCHESNTIENTPKTSKDNNPSSLETLFGNDTTTHHNNHHSTWNEDDNEGDNEGDNEEENEEDIQSAINSMNTHFGEPAEDMEPLKSASVILNVKNAEEFIFALGSDVTIIIDSDEDIDITEIIKKLPEYNYKTNMEPGIYTNYEETLLLVGITNLTIQGKSENPERTHIATQTWYADVISTYKCSNIQFRNLKLGHKVEEGGCDGGVLYLDQTNNVEIDNCKLYGCGVNGLTLSKCDNINVTNTEIYKCSDYAMSAADTCNNVLLKNCNIWGCANGFFTDKDVQRIELRQCQIDVNEAQVYGNGPLRFTDTEWYQKRED